MVYNHQNCSDQSPSLRKTGLRRNSKRKSFLRPHWVICQKHIFKRLARTSCFLYKLIYGANPNLKQHLIPPTAFQGSSGETTENEVSFLQKGLLRNSWNHAVSSSRRQSNHELSEGQVAAGEVATCFRGNPAYAVGEIQKFCVAVTTTTTQSAGFCKSEGIDRSSAVCRLGAPYRSAASSSLPRRNISDLS